MNYASHEQVYEYRAGYQVRVRAFQKEYAGPWDYLVQVIKLTSLASVVGFVELTRAGQIINNSLFQPFLVFVLVGAFYFVLCYPLSLWSRAMERKLNVGNR